MTDNPMPDFTTFDPALNLARQALYRFAALSLLDPRGGAWEQLSGLASSDLLRGAAELLRSEPSAIQGEPAPGEMPLEDLDAARVLALLPVSAAALNQAYERVFGLLVSNACPPYETQYIDSKFTFQRSNALADVSGFYAAFGFRPASANPERHDHIVLELEFMAVLLGMQRRAAESGSAGREQRRAVCLAAQRRFLQEHLAWWAPALARLLGKEDPGGFYAAAGVFLAALIPAERALLGVEAAPRVVAPSMVERPEACEGCLLADF